MVMFMKKKVKKENNGKRKNLLYKVISALLAVVSIIFIGILFYIDLLPTKYMMIIVAILLIFNAFNILLLNLRRLKKKIKKVISVIVILTILIMLLGSFYICRTLGVLLNNGDSKYKLEHYSVLVLSSSNYKDIKDIENETIGYYVNSTGAEDANEYLSRQINVDFESYQASDTLISDLLNSDVKAILIEDSIKNIMEEELSDFSKSVKVLYAFTIKVKVESTLKDVNVTKDSFVVYISGIDTYGEISSVSRSDVNMIMVVNPTIKQVLLISIPRDYYVQLHGTTGVKDKLTHAGIYGVDMSIKTLEDLLDVEINYYLKVNFTSVIDIVDALDGLDVYSEYSFISYSGFSFKEGYNKVNGEQALDFARTRKAFSDGDRQRGKNQQALIEAIIRKATSKSIITKYNSLLNAIDGKYQTNMSSRKITSLIKMQLNNMTSWNITSYSLTGTDSYNYTYTYNQLLYVMEPDENSVEEASKLIDQVLANEVLDGSYGEITGNINKVTQVQTTKPSTPSTTNSSSLESSSDYDDNEKNDDSIDDNQKDDTDKSSDESLDNDDSESKNPEDDNTDSSDISTDESEEMDDPIVDIIPTS